MCIYMCICLPRLRAIPAVGRDVDHIANPLEGTVAKRARGGDGGVGCGGQVVEAEGARGGGGGDLRLRTDLQHVQLVLGRRAETGQGANGLYIVYSMQKIDFSSARRPKP